MKNFPEKSGIAENERELRLLHLIAEENRDAIAELYKLYYARLFKFVFRLTRSYGAAEELVNDIMHQVWRGASGFRGESKVSTWVFGIAYRMAMRRISRRKIKLAPGMDPDQFATDGRGLLEDKDWVRHGLSRLPAAQQVTVQLVFYLGLSYEETAEVTQCPVNTVKTRMFHARRKLREILLQSSDVPGNPCENSDD
jgi:RNA polymerase sigma-70 factor (ECF subfamily)